MGAGTEEMWETDTLNRVCNRLCAGLFDVSSRPPHLRGCEGPPALQHKAAPANTSAFSITVAPTSPLNLCAIRDSVGRPTTTVTRPLTASTLTRTPAPHLSISLYMVRLLAGAQRSSLPNDMSQPKHHSTSTNSNHNNHNNKQQQQQQQQQQHTLVLIQSTNHASTRHYSDHASLDAALDSIVAAFEQQLTSRSQHLQYDIAQLFGYVDALPDLAVLVFAPSPRAYEPHDKQWVKSAIYEHLKRQAAGQ